MQRIYVYVKYNPEWQNLKFNSTNNKNKRMGKTQRILCTGHKNLLRL